MELFYTKSIGENTGYFKYLGIGNSVNVSAVCEELNIDKNELTIDDFIVEPQYATKSSSGNGIIFADGFDEVEVETGGGSSYTLSKTYDPISGIFTCSSKTINSSYANSTRRSSGASCSSTAESSCKIYLCKFNKEIL